MMKPRSYESLADPQQRDRQGLVALWRILIVAVAASFLLLISPSFAEEKVPPGMIRISAGSYTPLFFKDAKKREVAEFLIDVKPVTNAEYLEFVRENPKWRRSQAKRLFADDSYLNHWAGDLDLGPDAERIAGAPVTNVSWFAARAYLKSKGKRLPTEDEWEYVACASESVPDASRDPKFTGLLLEWYGKPNTGFLPRVAEAKPNYYGVSAMHGYVWEWVRDFNNSMVTGESRGDSGLDRSLYCAGGALGTADPHNYAAFMRYAFRSSLKGNYAVSILGFRGARSIVSNPSKKSK
jgi:formylglycine-generating enzyme required for sulfatase activity